MLLGDVLRVSGRNNQSFGRSDHHRSEELEEGIKQPEDHWPKIRPKSASAVSQGICPICKEEIEDSGHDVVEIQQRGAKGINKASGKRGDDIVVTDGDKVHASCRKRVSEWVSGGLTPCRQLRPSSRREHVNEKYIKSE